MLYRKVKSTFFKDSCKYYFDTNSNHTFCDFFVKTDSHTCDKKRMKH